MLFRSDRRRLGKGGRGAVELQPVEDIAKAAVGDGERVGVGAVAGRRDRVRLCPVKTDGKGRRARPAFGAGDRDGVKLGGVVLDRKSVG